MRSIPGLCEADAILAPSVSVSYVDAHDVPEVVEVFAGLRLGKVGGLVSPGGVGKSMFALQLAIDIAIPGSHMTGLDIRGHGATLMIAAEEDATDFHERLKPMLAGLSVKDKTLLNERLHFVPLRGAFDIMDEKWLNAVIARAVKVKARLVVLDTLRRMHSLNEISSEDMTRVVSRMELIANSSGASERSVLYLHHSTKSSIQGGLEAKQSDVRGTTVLVDNVKWVAILASVTKKEAKAEGLVSGSDYVRCSVVKVNRGRIPEPHFLKRSDGGMLQPVHYSKFVRSGASPTNAKVSDVAGIPTTQSRLGEALEEMAVRREQLWKLPAEGANNARPF